MRMMIFPSLASLLVFGCMPAKEAPPEEPPAESTSTGFPAQQQQAPTIPVVILQRTVTAYDPTNPSKPIGEFLAGTPVEIGPMAATPGMAQVTYRDPAGTTIVALCQAHELAQGPAPSQPEGPKIEPIKPKGLGGSRPPQSNPNYKGLGQPPS